MPDSAATITPATIVVRAAGPVACEVDGAFVILEPDAGRYFGTEGVGATIWRLVAEPISIDTISRRVVEQYDVEPTRCAADVLAFIEHLRAKGLVAVSDAPRVA